MSSADFWKGDPKQVANKALLKTMIVGDEEFLILKAEGYPAEENNRGIYKPIYENGTPGDVYCPRARSSILLLISTGNGGCVLIRFAEVNGQVYDGPGKLTERIGILEPKQWGSMEQVDEDTFKLRMDRLPEPQNIPGKPKRVSCAEGNGLGPETLNRLMERIWKYYKKHEIEIGFVEFLNQLLGECDSEKALRSRLRKKPQGAGK